MKNKNYIFNKLREHIGHSIDIVGYSNSNLDLLHPTFEYEDVVNVSIECLDCNEVLIDYEKEDE